MLDNINVPRVMIMAMNAQAFAALAANTTDHVKKHCRRCSTAANPVLLLHLLLQEPSCRTTPLDNACVCCNTHKSLTSGSCTLRLMQPPSRWKSTLHGFPTLLGVTGRTMKSFHWPQFAKSPNTDQTCAGLAGITSSVSILHTVLNMTAKTEQGVIEIKKECEDMQTRARHGQPLYCHHVRRRDQCFGDAQNNRQRQQRVLTAFVV
jgi:hypothetical protein